MPLILKLYALKGMNRKGKRFINIIQVQLTVKNGKCESIVNTQNYVSLSLVHSNSLMYLCQIKHFKKKVNKILVYLNTLNVKQKKKQKQISCLLNKNTENK